MAHQEQTTLCPEEGWRCDCLAVVESHTVASLARNLCRSVALRNHFAAHTGNSHTLLVLARFPVSAQSLVRAIQGVEVAGSRVLVPVPPGILRQVGGKVALDSQRGRRVQRGAEHISYQTYSVPLQSTCMLLVASSTPHRERKGTSGLPDTDLPERIYRARVGYLCVI